MFVGKCIFLIIGGGIVVYKLLDLICWLWECGVVVIFVMINFVVEFVMFLFVFVLVGIKVFVDFFDLIDEVDMGYI